MKQVVCAAYVATMAGPVLRDGAVAFDESQILEAGPAAAVRRGHPDAQVVELGNAVVLPGLINAHTHLELTGVGQLPRPGTFVDWVLGLRERMGRIGDFEAFVAESVRAGVRQCLRLGVTAVGDVSLNPAISRAIIREAGLRGVSFGEVLGMAGRVGQMETRIAAAVDRSEESADFRAGIEPHAPYSLDLVGYRRCLEEAAARAMPLATHLAETADEGEFLAAHTGAFRRLWEALGAWTEGVSHAEGGPIRVMDRLGLLDYPTVLAHVNYVDDEELAMLARGRASVVYCPRTHAYFGHPRHPMAEMLERAINVAVGTDSCASSPDLNLVEELRLVHRLHPEFSPEKLWGLVTDRAGRALGFGGRLGQTAPGFAPDLCVFGVATEEPLREILERDVLPLEVWMSGERVDHAAAT